MRLQVWSMVLFCESSFNNVGVLWWSVSIVYILILPQNMFVTVEFSFYITYNLPMSNVLLKYVYFVTIVRYLCYIFCCRELKTADHKSERSFNINRANVLEAPLMIQCPLNIKSTWLPWQRALCVISHQGIHDEVHTWRGLYASGPWLHGRDSRAV